MVLTTEPRLRPVSAANGLSTTRNSCTQSCDGRNPACAEVSALAGRCFPCSAWVVKASTKVRSALPDRILVKACLFESALVLTDYEVGPEVGSSGCGFLR